MFNLCHNLKRSIEHFLQDEVLSRATRTARILGISKNTDKTKNFERIYRRIIRKPSSRRQKSTTNKEENRLVEFI